MYKSALPASLPLATYMRSSQLAQLGSHVDSLRTVPSCWKGRGYQKKRRGSLFINLDLHKKPRKEFTMSNILLSLISSHHNKQSFIWGTSQMVSPTWRLSTRLFCSHQYVQSNQVILISKAHFLYMGRLKITIHNKIIYKNII